jgi:hypothetical protein
MAIGAVTLAMPKTRERITVGVSHQASNVRDIRKQNRYRLPIAARAQISLIHHFIISSLIQQTELPDDADSFGCK